MKFLMFLTISLLILVSISSFGQTIERAGVEAQYGFIIPHSSDLVSVSQSNPFGLVLDYQRLNLSKKSWLACHCFHNLGLQFNYHNFNNPDVLGAALSLVGTFEPILIKKNHWELSLKSGIGVTYLSRIHDPETNPANNFFSSHLSFLAFIAPKVSYAISPQWQLSASFNYNHISNGGQRQPNRGMNFPTFGLGTAYRFKVFDFPDNQESDYPTEWQWYLEGGFTTKQSNWSPGRKAAVNLAFGSFKPISPINGFGGGVELTKDFSLEVEQNRWEALMPAPFIAHHFIFGKFDFSQRFARYTQKPEGYVQKNYYQRYLILYQVYSDLQFGVSLKAHGHVAENIDIRIGWKF